MGDKEKLYAAFGDLLYAVALADGEIQDVEVEAMKERLKDYPDAHKIIESFGSNENNNISIEAAYQKAIEVCKHHGPDPEYALLLELLVTVAKAYMGIVQGEKKIINDFIRDLKTAFAG